MIVREAQLADLDWLIQQLRLFSDFFSSKIPLFPADESYARGQLSAMIEKHYFRIAEVQDNRAVLGASGQPLGEARAGFIAALLSQHWFNPALTTATEIFWWVSPAFRGTRAGALLLVDYIRWAKKNSHWVAFGLEENSPIKDATLIRHGFRLKERSFLMEVG